LHETYVVAPGAYESMYVDMPPTGLGAIRSLAEAAGVRDKARGRIRLSAPAPFKEKKMALLT
jgi:hypothetical protein